MIELEEIKKLAVSLDRANLKGKKSLTETKTKSMRDQLLGINLDQDQDQLEGEFRL